MSLAERAYRELEERIVTLQLPPGAVLSEQKLAKELGIGRSPIREARQRLAQDGLVIVLPQRGILVSEINIGNHRKLLLVRRVIDGLMVRSACEFANAIERKEFLQLAREFDKAAKEENVKVFMQIDARFNKLLLLSANNEFIDKTAGLMSGLTRRFWYKFCEIADQPRCARLHAKIARAVAKNDANGAVASLNSLVDYLEKLTLVTLENRQIRS